VWLDSIEERMKMAITLYQLFDAHQIEAYRLNPMPTATYWELNLLPHR
jgi:hypothetical protein